MEYIRPFQRQKRELSALPSSSLLQPVHAFAPVRPTGEQQTQLDQEVRSGWSFAHIAITRDDLDPASRQTTQTSSPSEQPLPQGEIPLQRAIDAPHSRENRTGLPDPLKTGIEALAGLSLNDVHVHYNSPKPAEVQALAYTQGTEIHVGPGQEQHLPHEAWHVVQQKRGLVRPMLQVKGTSLNVDQTLEAEADAQGIRAAQQSIQTNHAYLNSFSEFTQTELKGSPVIQGVLTIRITPQIQKKSESTVLLMRIEDRAPTIVKDAQGEHTIASTLLIEQVVRQLIGKTFGDGLQALYNLVQQIDPNVSAMHIDYYTNKKFQIKPASVLATIQDAVKEHVKEPTDPEIKWLILADFAEQFLRLTNKQEFTAYLKKDQETGGGGEEDAAMKRLREIDSALENGEIKPENEDVITDFANAIRVLMDFSLVDRETVLDRASAIIERAVSVAINVVPKMKGLQDRVTKKISAQAIKEYMKQKLPDDDAEDPSFNISIDAEDDELTQSEDSEGYETPLSDWEDK